MATVAPAAAMSRAMARPIPVAPPVRSTTRSFREGISPCLLVLFVNSPASSAPQKLGQETVQEPGGSIWLGGLLLCRVSPGRSAVSPWGFCGEHRPDPDLWDFCGDTAAREA